MDASPLLAQFLSLGLLGTVLIALTEKLAPVVPSYVMLMLLGMTVADVKALVVMILATAAGSLTGSMIWYGIGRSIGGPRIEMVVARFGKYIFLKPQVYQRLADAYWHNHFRVTLIGQIVPVARIYLALPAGVLRLQAAPFVAATALGILMWNTPFLVLGFLLRGTGHDPAHVGFWSSIILVALEIAIFSSVRRLGFPPIDCEQPDGSLPANIRAAKLIRQ
ncbi:MULTISPECIES: DedA family protein [unclassified Methylosinus]|uniref:DedA family protein n=1 Tax=unclassified Methylosinus TaxID=2624500 RepID=UPI00046786F5|nr:MULTISPECIES: VTT domain-containing protein [unclassified Methylosinus]